MPMSPDCGTQKSICLSLLPATVPASCSPMARHCSDQSIGRSVRRLTQNPRGRRPFPTSLRSPATFEDAFAALQEGSADLGMIPIENSIAGRVADIHTLCAGARRAYDVVCFLDRLAHLPLDASLRVEDALHDGGVRRVRARCDVSFHRTSHPKTKKSYCKYSLLSRAALSQINFRIDRQRPACTPVSGLAVPGCDPRVLGRASPWI